MNASDMIRLIVGLGNPGEKYVGTRHNIGREILEALAHHQGGQWTKGPGSQLRWVKGAAYHLIIPETFMNLSGQAAGGFIRFFKISPEAMLVVHDDLDLPFGDIRLSEGGTSGGHRGVESIVSVVGSDQFWRLRVGIGRPHPAERDPEQISVYVLERFSLREQTDLPTIVDGAVRLLVGLGKTAPKAQTLHLLRANESEA